MQPRAAGFLQSSRHAEFYIREMSGMLTPAAVAMEEARNSIHQTGGRELVAAVGRTVSDHTGPRGVGTASSLSTIRYSPLAG